MVYYLRESYRATAHKEIDYEKIDTDIIIRADVYRMRRDKQQSDQYLSPDHHGRGGDYDGRGERIYHHRRKRTG